MKKSIINRFICFILIVSLSFSIADINLKKVDAAALVPAAGYTIAELLGSLAASVLGTYLVYDTLNTDFDSKVEDATDMYLSSGSNAEALEDDQVNASGLYKDNIIQFPNKNSNDPDKKVGLFGGIIVTKKVTEALTAILNMLKPDVDALGTEPLKEDISLIDIYCNSDLYNYYPYKNMILASKEHFNELLGKVPGAESAIESKYNINTLSPFMVEVYEYNHYHSDLQKNQTCTFYRSFFHNSNKDFDLYFDYIYNNIFYCSYTNLDGSFRFVSGKPVFGADYGNQNYAMYATKTCDGVWASYPYKYDFTENSNSILYLNPDFDMYFGTDTFLYKFNHNNRSIEQCINYEFVPVKYLANPYSVNSKDDSNYHYDYSTTINKTINHISAHSTDEADADKSILDLPESAIVEYPYYDYSTLSKINNEIIPEVQSNTDIADHSTALSESINNNVSNTFTGLNNTASSLEPFPDAGPGTVPNPDSSETSKPDTEQTEDLTNYNYENPDLRDIFPFCIPFDFANIISLLEAEPEAISFEIPCFSITKNYTLKKMDTGIKVDLALFDDVAALFRKFMLIVFIFGLILASSKLIGGGKT